MGEMVSTVVANSATRSLIILVRSRGLEPPHPYGYVHLKQRVCQFRHDRKTTFRSN